MRILYSIVQRGKPMKFLLALHVCKVTRLDTPVSSMCMYTQTDRHLLATFLIAENQSHDLCCQKAAVVRGGTALPFYSVYEA